MYKSVLFIIKLASLAAVTTITPVLADGNFKFKQVNGVVELFTSQGCSSCPPADAYIGKLKTKFSDKLVLTYAVSIWDYLGWKDKFANQKNTLRQRSYNHYIGLNSVYTPQFVVDGMVSAMGKIGVDKHNIVKKLSRSHLKLKNVKVPMSIVEDNMKLKIKIADAPKDLLKFQKSGQPLDATLWLVKYKTLAKVDIKSGENSGRAVGYNNVVGDFMPLGMWEGKPQEFTISFRDLKGMVGNLKTNKFAFLLQLDGVGAIVSAIKVN